MDVCIYHFSDRPLLQQNPKDFIAYIYIVYGIVCFFNTTKAAGLAYP